MYTYTYDLVFFFSLWNATIIFTRRTPACKVPSDFSDALGGFRAASLGVNATDTSIASNASFATTRNHQQKYQDSFPLPKEPSKSCQQKHILVKPASWMFLFFHRRKIYLHLAKHLLATLFSKVAGDIPSFSSFSSSFDKLMILQVWQNPAQRSSLWSHRRAPWESVRCVRTTALKERFWQEC